MEFEYCLFCMEHIEKGRTCTACGASQNYEAPLHHLKPGSVLRDKYLIGKAIGEGGFGITYIGRDLTLDMPIAIKEYYPNGFSNRNNDHSNAVTISKGNHGHEFEREIQRFLSEARVLARFCNNPGVVGVRDFFRENGTAYIVMEYLDGITLKNYLKKYGTIPAETLAQMIDPILLALHEIHQQGLIHRDISPDNIMMLKNGQLKILDFGAAREVAGDKSLSVMLKPGYAPEEQYRSKGQQGPWTDVYAMCATIYKCITGITPDESIQRVFDDELKKPSELGIAIPEGFEQALMQGLNVKSDDRLQNMDVLRRALSAQNQEIPRDVQIQRVTETVTVEADSMMEGTIDLTQTINNREKIQPEPLDIPAKNEIMAEKAKPVQPSNAVAVSAENPPVKQKPVKKKKSAGKIVVAIIAVVVAITLALGIIGGVAIAAIALLSGNGSDMDENLPTERIMAEDCGNILREQNIAGGVLDLTVQDSSLNEKFKTYTVNCQVTVAQNGEETDYAVVLRYEYEDGEWELSDLSQIK